MSLSVIIPNAPDRKSPLLSDRSSLCSSPQSVDSENTLISSSSPAHSRSSSLTAVEEDGPTCELDSLNKLPRRSTGVPLTRSYAIDEQNATALFFKEKAIRKPPSKERVFLPPKSEYHIIKHHLKELVPWLLEHRPIGAVPRPTNVAYFPILPKPISLSPGTSRLDHLKLHYGLSTPKRFVLVQTLDGMGEINFRKFLATHEPERPNDSRHFVVLTVFVKSDGAVRLDVPTPRSTLRRELRVHKRLAGIENKEREFVLVTAGVMENERAHYLILVSFRLHVAG